MTLAPHLVENTQTGLGEWGSGGGGGGAQARQMLIKTNECRSRHKHINV